LTYVIFAHQIFTLLLLFCVILITLQEDRPSKRVLNLLALLKCKAAAMIYYFSHILYIYIIHSSKKTTMLFISTPRA